MRENREISLIGDSVELIPYLAKHVERYHEWMKDPFLQEMTASEPLSLDEEYAMQKEWCIDPKKCTFIIANIERDVEGNRKIIGDVNLFLNDEDDDHKAEIEIMIAEAAERGKGKGRESVNLMMSYGVRSLGIKTFEAKISMNNKNSLHLFEHRLQFQEVSRSEVFKEITLQRSNCTAEQTVPLSLFPFLE